MNSEIAIIYVYMHCPYIRIHPWLPEAFMSGTLLQPHMATLITSWGSFLRKESVEAQVAGQIGTYESYEPRQKLLMKRGLSSGCMGSFFMGY